MADISKITLPSGSTYNIKDATARSMIADITGASTGAMHFLGVTTTALADDSTTQTITISGESYTAQAGDVVIYGESEFVWSGASSKWILFGDLGSLKALAFKDSASGSYTPAGTISSSFTGTSFSSTGSYTPEGDISTPTFTGTAGSVSVTGKSAGSVTVKGKVGSATPAATFAPTGTVSTPDFTGTAATIVISKASSGDATYTPQGTVSKPNITVTPSSTTVNSITNVGSLPALTTTVSNETLTIGWDAGDLPTKGSNTSVMTGATAALASAPSFTGTGARLTGSYTPAGTVSQPSFTGNNITLSGSFSGSNVTSTGSFTPAGTISEPEFTGTAKTVSVSGTPTGTVESTFTGTAATITVN